LTRCCIPAIFHRESLCLLRATGAKLRLRIASTVIAVMGLMPAWAGAQGFGLPIAGFATGGAGLTSFYVIGFELGPWQEYLAQELTPVYMLPENTEPMRISWLRNSEIEIMPDFAAHLESPPPTRLLNLPQNCRPTPCWC